jgi:phage I-like protein
MKNQILNSKQTIPEDMTLAVQVAPEGKFKGVLNKADGTKKNFVQNLDSAAFERVLNSWKSAGSPELLVDADHLSCDGGSTRAYAWASNLRVEKNGLVADFKFTDEGAKAVNSREFRFVSPVFDVSENGEIAALSSIALTNRPNLPVSCVLNRESTGVKNVEDTKDKPKMDKILNALGLGPGASEDDAVAAIAKVKNERDEAKSALVKNAAEKFADDNKDRIENRQAVVDLYVKNGKDVAEAFLAAFKAPEKAPEKPAQTVLNAKSGVTPGTVTPLREGLAKCRNAAEKCAYITAHAAEFAAEGK